MFLSEWREFPSVLCLAGGKKLMTARVSMFLKSRASLTCFLACFLPGRAKVLSAPPGTINGRASFCIMTHRNMTRVEMKKKQENAVGSQNGPRERCTEPLQNQYIMLQTYAHAVAVHSQLIGHSSPKYTELSIQLLDDNRFLHLCHNTVVLVH